MHCLFCEIVAGRIPSARVLETDDAVAFLDLGPVNAGHVLLVPREHHADLSELSDALAAKVGALLPRLSRAIRRATEADGLNVVINNGEAAGQTIFHGHWHLIPRFFDDAVNWPWPHLSYAGDEMETMRASLVRELEATAAEN